ncbi:MAG: HRDC domain-containing protein [Planctomycetota bacterium]|nr:HRDC domain-containing protein [Planctomycetota bacterium]
MSGEPPVHWVDTPEALPTVAAACAQAPWLALDVEANGLHAYRERCCLIQLYAGSAIFVIDPLALRREDLAPLRPAFADRQRCKWLHGGELDVALLRRDCDLPLAGVFDSQQAAALLGWEATGYGAVVERLLGIRLEKAYAHYDWASRPLDPGALRYAVEDVRYLPLVGQRLRELVIAADLLEETEIACQAVEASTRREGFEPGGFWRVPGARALPKDRLPVLAALWAWRDRVARELDKPPGRLLNNQLLIALSRQPIYTWAQLKQLGIKGWLLASHGEDLLACLRRAREEPPPLPPPPQHREVAPEEERRERRLKDWRQAEAKRRGVSLQAVLPAKALEHLKRYGAGDLASVPQLGAKRIALYGDKLRTLAE